MSSHISASTVPLPPAILLMGPTASGKTGVAVELIQQLNCEIISVDSALVYRDMNIGTAKPDAETLARAPHHLIDLITPEQSYSAAQFRMDALNVMRDITANGRVPLLVGGTMMYFKTLQFGLNDLPVANKVIRADLEAQAKDRGWPALHADLAKIDPPTAARLKPNDSQRIQRALEIYHVTGRPMSEQLGREEVSDLPYRIIPIALLPSDRAQLHQRIVVRFDQMLKNGLVEETQGLIEKYQLNADMPSMRCVGYRQAWQYLNGELDLGGLREKGIIATRQLAKRQLTWLRSMDGVREFDCLAPDTGTKIEDYLKPMLMVTSR